LNLTTTLLLLDIGYALPDSEWGHMHREARVAHIWLE
jgi:hypothetical protein